MIRKLTLFAPALALIVSVYAAPAQAQTWTIDTAHSHVGFKVRHMMVSWVRGEFHKVDATITLNPKKLKQAQIDVTIDVAGIDTENEKRDEHLRSADFFDAERFPTMTFTSTAVKPGKGDSFQLIGDLTIRGVTREVILDVEGGLEPVSDPWGNVKLGFSASTVIDRKDFGLTWNKNLDAGGVLVSDEVRIEIELELNKAEN